MDLKIEYFNNHYLEFSINDIAYLLGPDSKMQWQLTRSLRKYLTGKSLTDLEENVYGDDGISFSADNEPVSVKNKDFFVFDSRESILQEFYNKKGTLLFNSLDELKADFDIQYQIEVLNNELLKIENILANKLSSNLSSINLSLLPISLDDILKKSISVDYIDHNESYPIAMMDIENIIFDFCLLLEKRLEAHKEKHGFGWLTRRHF